ncbi:MAG: PD-(D/E)XK nuclease family protein [Candidatus Acidiferrales bacterium]
MSTTLLSPQSISSFAASFATSVGIPNPVCPKCQCKHTVKKGKRRNRLQTLQVYECSECLHRFTAGDAGKNKTYPLKIILEALSTFNLGYSLTETQHKLHRRFHREIPERTISSWLAEHRTLATYHRLRRAARKLYGPQAIIRTVNLEHQQAYQFQVHRAKLDLLLSQADHAAFQGLKQYFASVDDHFPHQLFLASHQRSSKFPVELHPPITRKENNATRLAALALPTSPTNRKRHETLQRFMLINDSVTVAVEIPVYLTREDVAYYRSRGFDLTIDTEVITGHIDFLQVRNGFLHILDYKPEASKEKHAHVQVTIYALALARRTRLPLKMFKCAWFDEKDYFEFFPLQGVYKAIAGCG